MGKQQKPLWLGCTMTWLCDGGVLARAIRDLGPVCHGSLAPDKVGGAPGSWGGVLLHGYVDSLQDSLPTVPCDVSAVSQRLASAGLLFSAGDPRSSGSLGFFLDGKGMALLLSPSPSKYILWQALSSSLTHTHIHIYNWHMYGCCCRFVF